MYEYLRLLIKKQKLNGMFFPLIPFVLGVALRRNTLTIYNQCSTLFTTYDGTHFIHQYSTFIVRKTNKNKNERNTELKKEYLRNGLAIWLKNHSVPIKGSK